MPHWKALLASLALLLGACGAAVPETPPAAARLPNPSDAKCVADGWRTEPILGNGVPTGTMCIEPDTGRRCEAWAYFRGECPAKDSGHPAREQEEPGKPDS